MYKILFKIVTLDHKTSHKSHGYICSNSQQYIVWVKSIINIDFSFMPKIIRILSKDHVPWRLEDALLRTSFGQLYRWFSQYFDFFAPSDSRFSNSYISAKHCPILTKHTSMEILFIQLSDDRSISISTNRLVLWSRVTILNCFLLWIHDKSINN